MHRWPFSGFATGYERGTLRLVAEYTLPASATIGADFEPSYDERGRGLLLQNGQCIELNESGLFKERKPGECRKLGPAKLTDEQKRKLGAGGPVQALSSEGDRFILVYAMQGVC